MKVRQVLFIGSMQYNSGIMYCCDLALCAGLCYLQSTACIVSSAPWISFSMFDLQQVVNLTIRGRFSCCWGQTGRQCVHSPSNSEFFLACELSGKTWWQNVILSLHCSARNPIRNSLIRRLIFAMCFVPLWTSKECATGNISILVSTVAIKPRRLQSIKSLMYLALKLPLASIISYCKAHQKKEKTNKNPMPVIGSLNRSSDRFTSQSSTLLVLAQCG